jgi:hypothetical protein
MVIMPCAACNVWNRPEDLWALLVHPDGRDEPRVEGPLCKGCLDTRVGEIEAEGMPGTIREIAPVRAFAEWEEAGR